MPSKRGSWSVVVNLMISMSGHRNAMEGLSPFRRPHSRPTSQVRLLKRLPLRNHFGNCHVCPCFHHTHGPLALLSAEEGWFVHTGTFSWLLTFYLSPRRHVLSSSLRTERIELRRQYMPPGLGLQVSVASDTPSQFFLCILPSFSFSFSEPPP